MTDPTITLFTHLGNKLNSAFELLGPNWKNPPMSDQIVRQTLFFVATELPWDTDAGRVIIGQLFGGIGSDSHNVQKCLLELKRLAPTATAV